MSTQISEPVRWVRSQVIPWLEDSQRNPEQLVKWLQGDDLPAVGHDDSPYQLILDCLPVGADRHRHETLLATLAAQLLTREPDRQPLGDRPAKLLYNLLLLCSHLTKRDILAEPLYAMFERGQLNGEWNGVSLPALLRSALIMNQADARLQSVWVAMCGGIPDAFLQGSLYDGIDGVRLMRPSREIAGTPAFEAIGQALQAAAVYLEKDDLRKGIAAHARKFCALLERVKATYPDWPDWDAQFARLARQYQWPNWARQCFNLPLSSIGKRLKEEADAIEAENEEQIEQFRHRIEQIKVSYHDWPAWDETFIRLADEFRWPNWAVKCLDLCVPIRDFAEVPVADSKVSQAAILILLKDIVIGFEESDYDIEEKFCNAEVLKVKIKRQEAAHMVKSLAHLVESHRLASPFKSARSLQGIVIQVFEKQEELQKRLFNELPHGRDETFHRRKELEVLEIAHLRALNKWGVLDKERYRALQLSAMDMRTL
jgi:hypothetical protein